MKDMTLDEAIKHAEEVADRCEFDTDWGTTANAFIDRSGVIDVIECSKEHRQLAEWLKELRDYRIRIPSYEAGYNDAKREISLSGEYERVYKRGRKSVMSVIEDIKAEIQKLLDWHDCPIELDNGNDAWYCEAVNSCLNIIDKHIESEKTRNIKYAGEYADSDTMMPAT